MRAESGKEFQGMPSNSDGIKHLVLKFFFFFSLLE